MLDKLPTEKNSIKLDPADFERILGQAWNKKVMFVPASKLQLLSTQAKIAGIEVVNRSVLHKAWLRTANQFAKKLSIFSNADAPAVHYLTLTPSKKRRFRDEHDVTSPLAIPHEVADPLPIAAEGQDSHLDEIIENVKMRQVATGKWRFFYPRGQQAGCAVTKSDAAKRIWARYGKDWEQHLLLE